jgi:hypothetical protein
MNSDRLLTDEEIIIIANGFCFYHYSNEFEWKKDIAKAATKAQDAKTASVFNARIEALINDIKAYQIKMAGIPIGYLLLGDTLEKIIATHKGGEG